MQNSCNRLWVCILRVRVLRMFACSCACCELKRRVSTLETAVSSCLTGGVFCVVSLRFSVARTRAALVTRESLSVYICWVMCCIGLWFRTATVLGRMISVASVCIGVSGFPCPLWYFYVDFGNSLSGSERCLHCKSLLPHVRIYWSGWALSNWDRVAKPVTI